MSVQRHDSSEQRLWLFSPGADFWLACGGASVGLLTAILLIFLRGDREIDALDFVLSEFHLGATYHAVIQRRLWRRLPVDVLLVPLVILAITYVFSMTGQTILLTSIAMYAAIWHRGRQSLGVARFYQRSIGGLALPPHNRLFHGAVYLPMLAAGLAYTHLAPLEYEGEPYLALNLGREVTSLVAIAAAGWVIAYFAWTLWQSRAERLAIASPNGRIQIHPGEWWVVLAHAVAFGSSYVLGASNASYMLVLAVHHEVQYLYFAYAMSRRSALHSEAGKTETNRAMSASYPTALCKREDAVRSELKHAASFLAWPVIGLAEQSRAGGWLSHGSLRWERAVSFVITGSMVAFGRGGH
jgi:hypothetical protein